MDVRQKSQPEVCLEIVVYHIVKVAAVGRAILQYLKISSHRYVVRFELRDDILSITASAEADPVAEVTDPTAIVFANVKIVVVAQLETGMAELAIAAILWLLCQ